MSDDVTPQNGDEAIAYRVKRLEVEMAELRRHLDAGFDRLDVKMSALTFVRHDVYTSERGAFEKEQKLQDERIDSAQRLAMWCLGILVTSILAAVFGIVSTLVVS